MAHRQRRCVGEQFNQLREVACYRSNWVHRCSTLLGGWWVVDCHRIPVGWAVAADSGRDASESWQVTVGRLLRYHRPAAPRVRGRVQRYQLRFVYGNLRSAIRHRDWPSAWQALGRAIAVPLPQCPTEAQIRESAELLRDQLSYRGAKPAELALLRHRVKTLVKLEDLPIEQALELAKEVAATHTTVPSSPYRKDYLLLRSQPAALTDRDVLVTLYCSVDSSAREIARMEANQREDPRRAGRMLQIPPCCIDAFVADCERSRHDQDTLNDDACRRVLATATPTAPGDWRLNPLANDELLGFYPCHARCPAAVDRARQVLAALPSAVARAAECQLRRPALYFRLPFFATFADRWQDDHLAVDDRAVNAMPDRAARTAQALFAAAIDAAVQQGALLDAKDLPWRMDAERADQGQAPLLCRWQ